MNTIVNFAMRVFGLGKAVDALDGESSKAYAGGMGQILTGAATLLGGLAGIVTQFIGAHGGAEYLAIAQGLSHNASAGLVVAGAGLISNGLSTIGQRHALAKAQAAASSAPAAAVATKADNPEILPAPKPEAPQP